MVPTPLFSFILDRMSSPRLPNTRLALASSLYAIILTNSTTCCPSSAEHVVDAEGLGRRGGRQGGVVHCVWELLLQLQVVQNQPVAVVGDAQTVRGLAVGGSSEVGADPGGQPGARVGAFRQQRPVQSPKRGVDPVEVPASVCREEAVRDSDLVDGQPGVALRRKCSRRCSHTQSGAGEQLLAQEAERRSHLSLSQARNALQSACRTFRS